MINSKTILAMLFVASLTFQSCKKDPETNTTDNEDFQTTAEDIGQSETVSSDIDNMTSMSRVGTFSNDNSQDPAYDQFSFHSCATVTNDSINHTVLIDFGTG